VVLSSEGGKVVIETTNGTLTADRIEFGTNTMTAMGGVSITYTNSVPGPGITRDGIEKLKQARPDLEIDDGSLQKPSAL
jgi:hypothetical protein